MKKPIPYINDNRADPTGFKARARAHQSTFRENCMSVDFVDLYGTKISIEDGHVGMKNFHPCVHDLVKTRYPRKRTTLYCDILRSEHIPFNLFGPLIYHKEVLVKVLNCYMNNTVCSIVKLEIEFAPKPKISHLNDATSFDTYIEYNHKDGNLGAIGVEVKYTEGDYKIGVKEAIEVADTGSLYWSVTKESGLYQPVSYSVLVTDRFRQIWRNHMLGESMKQIPKARIKHFTLLMVYPEGNSHMGTAALEYRRLLKENMDLKFQPVTFQSFLQTCEKYSTKPELEEWLAWCKLRYLHD